MKQQHKRIDYQDLTVDTANTQGEVHAFTGVQAKRSNVDFNGLGRMMSQVVQQRKAKRDEQRYQQGITDTGTDTVDQELLEDEAYAAGHNVTKGQAEGYKALGALTPKLNEALQNARAEGTLGEFNIDDFISEHIATFRGDSIDENLLKGFNSQIPNMQRIASSEYAKFRAGAEDAEILHTGFETLRSGMSVLGDAASKAQFLKDTNLKLKDTLGVNKVEYQDMVYKAAIHAGDIGDISTLEASMDWLKGQGKGTYGKYSSDLEKTLQIAESRIKTKKLEETAEEREQKLAAHWELEQTVGTDSFNYQNVSEARGSELITKEQALSMYKRHQAELKRKQGEAEKEVALGNITADELPYITDKPTRKEWFERHEKAYTEPAKNLLTLQRQFLNAEASGNIDAQKEVQSAINVEMLRIQPLLEDSQSSGHTPKFLTQVFEGATVGSPQFPAVARMLNVLKTRKGVTPFQDIDMDKWADIKAYNFLTGEMQYSSEEAQSILVDAQENPNSVVDPALFTTEGREEFNTQVDDLLDDDLVQVQRDWLSDDTETHVELDASMRESIKQIARVNARRGIPAERAVEMAVERFTATHHPIAGSWVPNKNMSPLFPEAFEQAIQEHPVLKDDDGLKILASGDLDGSLMIMKGDGTLLTHKDGRIFRATYDDFVTKNLKKLKDTKGSEVAEEVEETRTKHKQRKVAAEAYAKGSKYRHLIDKYGKYGNKF